MTAPPTRPVERERVDALFRPARADRPATAIGAELELLPVHARASRRVGIIDTAEGPGTATMIAGAARRHGWSALPPVYGAPAWTLPGGGKLSYEPGGQLEIGSPVFATPDALSRWLDDIVGALHEAAARIDTDLLPVGVDPVAPIEAVPLALTAERYARMARHFDSIGPAGARMMRQTASLQVSVELGRRPLERWRYLNSLAPYLLAASANSRRYAGADTGEASYRARLWRTLDPSRTGLAWQDDDPVGAYAAFASGATRILDDDDAHLTTLFPEVRPRGYFEVRSMDAVEPARAARLLTWLHTLVYEPDVARAAGQIVGAPDPALLERAGTHALHDQVIAERVRALGALAGIDVIAP